MGTKAPELSDLLFDRMELTAAAGLRIAEAAKARGRGLTQMELCEMKLMGIEQDLRLLEWAEQLRDEGHRVNLLDGPRPTPTSGLHVTNNTIGERPVVWLYDTIGEQFEGGISDTQFMEMYLEIPSNADVSLRIRSDGGDFYTALAMREVIMSRSGRTDAFIDGLAASAATLIACACSTTTMGIGSRYMIHEASGSLKGRADEFEMAAKQIKETNATIVKIYSERWKGTRAQLLDALHKETWFSDYETVQVGLADRVSDKLSLAATISPSHKYKHVPSELSIAAKLEDCPMRLAMELTMHRLAIVH